MVITEVFGNVVSRQLSHNVGDVSIGAEVLQPFMSATWWRKTTAAITTTKTAAAVKSQYGARKTVSEFVLQQYFFIGIRLMILL